MESTGMHSPPKRSSNGDYVYPGAYNAWKWWQAARRAQVVPDAYLVYVKGSARYWVVTLNPDDVPEIYKGGGIVPLYRGVVAPQPLTHDEIKLAWNAQADEFNQWDELGEDEKVEWAATYAVANLHSQNPCNPAL